MLQYSILLHELGNTFGEETIRALNRSDHFQLLRSLCKAPENQQTNPILFVLLYGAWCRQISSTTDTGTCDEASSDGRQGVRHGRQYSETDQEVVFRALKNGDVHHFWNKNG